ncbi:MAG: hypothetical protein WDA27_10060 [Actinomycetota bacterium]
MTRSNPRRTATTIALLALLGTSCSSFRVQSEVAIKQVPIDLTFGAKAVAAPSRPPLPPLPPLPRYLPPPPYVPVPVPPSVPAGPLCGVTTAIAARDTSTPDISSKQRPQEGTYLFNFDGGLEGEAAREGVTAYKTISSTAEEPEGFSYSIKSEFDGVVLHFEVRPTTEEQQLPGLFLKRVDIPQKKSEDAPATFIPASPLKLLAFPIEVGTSQTASGPDVASKRDTGISNPAAPGTIYQPSANTMTSRVDIGAREIIEVCADLAQAWKVNWDLKIAGDFNIEMIGTFWLDTAYGGWPVKDDFILTGDLANGNFASNLMKLDPGAYL